MVNITLEANAADPTKQYADNLWRDNPMISPNNWRILSGRTVSCLAGRVAAPFVETQTPHLKAALTGGINCWFLPITDFAAQKAFAEALNSTDIPRDALTLIYEFPLEHADKLAQELELLPLPNGITFTYNDALTDEALTTAFTAAEEAVKAGHIQFYGLTHSGLSAPSHASFHVKLSNVIEIAQKASQTAYGRRKRPSLSILNLPLNVLELGALRHPSQIAKLMDGSTEDVSTLELAGRGHLAVFAERPLSAATPNGGLWLTDDEHTAPLRTELLKRLNPAKGSYWASAPLENMALKTVTSLPSVTGAVVMPGVDYGQENLVEKYLTAFLQEADFPDVAQLVGMGA